MRLVCKVIILLSICSQALGAEKRDTTLNYTIDDVVVKSYRLDMMLKDAPNKIEIITHAQIARMSAIGIGDIIKKSTTAESVDLQGLTGGVEFRGFATGAMGTSRFSSMLIDGMPMGTMNAATTLLAGISSIEVLKGPFSALYGSGAMGGVINVITLQSRGKVGGSATVGYGSYNTTQASASVGGNLTKRLDFDMSLEYLKQNNSYKTGKHSLLRTSDYERVVIDDASYGKRYANTTFDKQGAILRLGYDIADNWRINLYNNLYYTAHAPSNGTLWEQSGYDRSDKGVLRNYHRADLTTNQGIHALRLSAYYSREKLGTDYDSPYMGKSSEDKTYKAYGFQLQDVISLSFGRLIVGVDNFSQRNKSTRRDADNVQVYPWNPDYLDMQTGVLAQLNVSLFDNRLTSVVGLRYDNTLLRTFVTPFMQNTSSSRSYNSINPTLALKYKLSRCLNIHGSMGRAFLAPSAYQTVGEYHIGTTYVGNNDLKPESAFTMDLGVGVQSGGGAFSADATIFSTHHKNLIGTQVLEQWTKFTFVNADKASMKGYEAMASFDLGRALGRAYSMKLFANYIRLFQLKVNKGGVESERLYVSRNNATFGAEYVDRRISVRVNGRYVGDKLNENFIRFDRQDGLAFRESLTGDPLLRLPDFMVFDVYVDCHVTHALSIGVKCANLLDENYMERDGYYMCGRNFMGQLSFRF